MKILIATACFCIIAITALIAFNQYMDFRRAEQSAFWDYCNQLDSPEQKAKIADWEAKNYQSELRLELKKVERCRDVAISGF